VTDNIESLTMSIQSATESKILTPSEHKGILQIEILWGKGIQVKGHHLVHFVLSPGKYLGHLFNIICL
jgi:hypothetical protein